MLFKQKKKSQRAHHIDHKHALELCLEAGGKTKELKDTNHNRYSRAYHKALCIYKKTMDYEKAKEMARKVGRAAKKVRVDIRDHHITLLLKHKMNKKHVCV